MALGALQGVTEFLPISSSGHLLLARRLLGMPDVPLLFDVVLHVATLVTVCIVFRHRLGSLTRATCRSLFGRRVPGDTDELRLLAMIVIATLATVAVGLPLAPVVVGIDLAVVGICFIAMAASLFGAHFFVSAGGTRRRLVPSAEGVAPPPARHDCVRGGRGPCPGGGAVARRITCRRHDSSRHGRRTTSGASRGVLLPDRHPSCMRRPRAYTCRRIADWFVDPDRRRDHCHADGRGGRPVLSASATRYIAPRKIAVVCALSGRYRSAVSADRLIDSLMDTATGSA